MSDARRRSRKKRIAFNLRVTDITRRVQRGYCEVTGLAFSLIPSDFTRNNPFAPSLDRHDPKQGYTPSNVRVVVTAYNAAKGEWPTEIFETVARAFIERNRA